MNEVLKVGVVGLGILHAGIVNALEGAFTLSGLCETEGILIPAPGSLCLDQLIGVGKFMVFVPV